MIKLNDKYSLSHKNGYFQVHTTGVRGAESKNAGEACIVKVETYARLLTVHKVLKERGIDGNVIMQAGQQLLDDYTFTIKQKKVD